MRGSLATLLALAWLLGVGPLQGVYSQQYAPPSESECRPYIERALKEHDHDLAPDTPPASLEDTGSSEETAGPEIPLNEQSDPEATIAAETEPESGEVNSAESVGEVTSGEADEPTLERQRRSLDDAATSDGIDSQEQVNDSTDSMEQGDESSTEQLQTTEEEDSTETKEQIIEATEDGSSESTEQPLELPASEEDSSQSAESIEHVEIPAADTASAESMEQGDTPTTDEASIESLEILEEDTTDEASADSTESEEVPGSADAQDSIESTEGGLTSTESPEQAGSSDESTDSVEEMVPVESSDTSEQEAVPVDSSESSEQDAALPVDSSESSEQGAVPAASSESSEQDAVPAVDSSESSEQDAVPAASSESSEQDAALPVDSSESSEQDAVLPVDSLESSEQGAVPAASSESSEQDAALPVDSSESLEEGAVPAASSESSEEGAVPPVDSSENSEEGAVPAGSSDSSEEIKPADSLASSEESKSVEGEQDLEGEVTSSEERQEPQEQGSSKSQESLDQASVESQESQEPASGDEGDAVLARERRSLEEGGVSSEEVTASTDSGESDEVTAPDTAEEPVVEKEEAGLDEEVPVTGAAAPEDVDEESREVMPEEELSFDVDIPDNLRPRDHIAQILKLDETSVEDEMLLHKVEEATLKELKRLYDNAIKPLEILYKYRDLSNRHFGDPEIFSKPLILFMGPWSGGKSTIINYLLDNEYTRTTLRTGAEPSPAYFNLLMWGEREEVLDGTQLAADWTFSGLQKFGQGLLDRLRGLRLKNRLLEKVNIVEIPGILEIRKQVERLFPFNDACQWFIDRADIIFLVYDPSKLDVGPETEAILDQLKGREYQTRIVLNKADQVRPEELMRVQGTLIWNISPLMSSSQPPVMYSTSLWSMPYEAGAPLRLLRAQERAFLRDMREAIDKRVENKIASARRFAVRVRNHAKMVDCYLTTYYNHKSFFGNRKRISDDIIEKPQDYHIYEGLSTLTNISRYDLPDPETYRDFFQLNPLYDFQQLSATCTYFKGCPINRLDIAIAYDLPELVGKYKKAAEIALERLDPAKS